LAFGGGGIIRHRAEEHHHQRQLLPGPLPHAPHHARGADGRGLHSFTFELNLSALYEIGGARRDCVAHDKREVGGV